MSTVLFPEHVNDLLLFYYHIFLTQLFKLTSLIDYFISSTQLQTSAKDSVIRLCQRWFWIWLLCVYQSEFHWRNTLGPWKERRGWRRLTTKFRFTHVCVGSWAILIRLLRLSPWVIKTGSFVWVVMTTTTLEAKAEEQRLEMFSSSICKPGNMIAREIEFSQCRRTKRHFSQCPSHLCFIIRSDVWKLRENSMPSFTFLCKMFARVSWTGGKCVRLSRKSTKVRKRLIWE